MMLRLVPATVLAVALAGAVVAQQSSAAPQSKSRNSAPAVSAASAVSYGAAKKADGFGADGGNSSANPGPGSGQPGQLDPMLDPRLRTARAPYPKVATVDLRLPIDKATNEVSTTGRIILKLRDNLGGRAPRQAAADRVYSTIGSNLGEFDGVLAKFGGTVQQWITHRDDRALREIELRAETRSGFGQPDLASFLVVTVPPAALLEAGRALNDLDIVEFVEFERPLVSFQNESCDPQNENVCNLPGTTCNPEFYLCNPDPGCQLDPEPDCRSGCADVDCCQLVAGFLPYCNDPEQPNGWDLVCAAYANLYCNQTIYDIGGPLPPEERYDPCFTDGTGQPNPIFVTIAPAISGSCFEPRDTRGCNQSDCCFAVCNIDPTCCNQAWDAGCVALAASDLLLSACVGDTVDGPTPDFTSFEIVNPNFGSPGQPPFLTGNSQAYTSKWPAASDFPPLPNDPQITFLSSGFRGGGYDLAGLRALQKQFADLYQDGIEPLRNGRTIRVGIVEFSAFVNHEDFVFDAAGQPLAQPKVIPEPNQTIILITGGANSPNHGTASLGINVAADNGFGVTGIAHEAQGYFFPTLSVEEGSRLPNAITTASELFDEGDVLNFSIGFPGAGPIIISPAIAGLIRLCSDLGITCVMSAGNDAIPIDAAPFETDGIVVGACYPGGNIPPLGCTAFGVFHYCRLNFSNFTPPDEANPLAVVHVSAWGTGVMTTGYGTTFRGANGTDPEDPETNNLRTYWDDFGGTSAAAPIITGLVACLQAMSRQLYGTPVTPAQIRGVLRGNTQGDQCWPLNEITLGPGPDQPECNDDEWRAIGEFPEALECGFAIMNGQFVSGNPIDIKIMYGTPANSVTSFRVRAADGNVLKVNTQNANAGNTISGLTYLATGATTDIYGYIQTNLQPTGVQNLSLNVVASATKPFVLLGGFMWNYVDQRWDFLGVNFIGPGGGGGAFPVPAVSLTKYLQPNQAIEARVWSCGLGLVGPHQVRYDFIEIGVNAPVIPAP